MTPSSRRASSSRSTRCSTRPSCPDRRGPCVAHAQSSADPRLYSPRQISALPGCQTLLMFKCPVCGSKELTAQPYAIWPPPPDAVYGPPYEDHLGDPSYEVSELRLRVRERRQPGDGPGCVVRGVQGRMGGGVVASLCVSRACVERIAADPRALTRTLCGMRALFGGGDVAGGGASLS